MSITEPNETWSEAESRWERNRRSLLQSMEIAKSPEAFTGLSLVVAHDRPNTKKQLAKTQKQTLGRWGI